MEIMHIDVSCPKGTKNSAVQLIPPEANVIFHVKTSVGREMLVWFIVSDMRQEQAPALRNVDKCVFRIISVSV